MLIKLPVPHDLYVSVPISHLHLNSVLNVEALVGCGVMRAAAHTPAYTTPNLHYHELQFCSEESTQPAPVFCGSPSSTPRPCGSETRPRRPRPAPRGPRGSRRGPGTPSPALKTGTKSIKVCSVIVSLTLLNAHYFSIHASHVQ